MIPQQLSISLPFPPIRKGGLQWFEPSALKDDFYTRYGGLLTKNNTAYSGQAKVLIMSAAKDQINRLCDIRDLANATAVHPMRPKRPCQRQVNARGQIQRAVFPQPARVDQAGRVEVGRGLVDRLQSDPIPRPVDALGRRHQNGGVPRRAHAMPSLTIKDIPDPLLTRLRQRAATDRRSLNREVLHLLDRALAEAPVAPASSAI